MSIYKVKYGSWCVAYKNNLIRCTMQEEATENLILPYMVNAISPDEFFSDKKY